MQSRRWQGNTRLKDYKTAITSSYLSGVVEDDNLGGEVSHAAGRLVLRVGGDVATLDVLHRDVLDVKAHIVPRGSLGQRLVVHLHGLHLEEIRKLEE